MTHSIRNRIKSHRRVRAGDLIPHEWNFRLHPELQKAALQALYQEIGFARSLLAYELPDGRLKLLDGTDAEARTLLLSLDPLAALAETQTQLHQRLLELTPTDSDSLALAWQS